MNLHTTADLMSSRELQHRVRAACAMHGIPLDDSVLVAVVKAAADEEVEVTYDGEEVDATCVTDEIIMATVAGLAATLSG